MPLISSTNQSPSSQSSGSTFTFGFLVLLCLALITRVGGATYWQQQASAEQKLLRLGDSHSYWTLAKSVARGQPYEYGSPNASVFRAPTYPITLAPFTLFKNESTGVWYARLCGCLLGTCSVALVALMAKSIGDHRSMIGAGLLAAVYPGAIGMSIVLLSEAVFCPLMLFQLWLWQRAWQSRNKRATFWLSFASGIVAGLAIMARPSWVLFTPFICGLGVLLGRFRSQHLRIGVYACIGICVAMSPWWIRNASLTHRFVPTTLQVGPSLYDGLHEGASGASDEGMQFMRALEQQQRQLDEAADRVESTFEYRLNQTAQQAAIEWATTHPEKVVRLALAKFCKTWSIWPNGGEVGSSTLRIGLTVGCFGIVGLSIIGSYFLRRNNPSACERSQESAGNWCWFVCWLPSLYFTLLHTIFVGSIRYREPAVLVLCVLGGVGLSQLLSRFRARQSS